MSLRNCISIFSNPAMMNAAKGAAKMTEQLQQIQGLPLAETTSFSMMGRNMTIIVEDAKGNERVVDPSGGGYSNNAACVGGGTMA